MNKFVEGDLLIEGLRSGESMMFLEVRGEVELLWEYMKFIK